MLVLSRIGIDGSVLSLADFYQGLYDEDSDKADVKGSCRKKDELIEMMKRLDVEI